MSSEAPKSWPFPTFKGKPLNRNPLSDDKLDDFVPVWDSVKTQRKESAVIVKESEDGLF